MEEAVPKHIAQVSDVSANKAAIRVIKQDDAHAQQSTQEERILMEDVVRF